MQSLQPNLLQKTSKKRVNSQLKQLKINSHLELQSPASAGCGKNATSKLTETTTNTMASGLFMVNLPFTSLILS